MRLTIRAYTSRVRLCSSSLFFLLLTRCIMRKVCVVVIVASVWRILSPRPPTSSKCKPRMRSLSTFGILLELIRRWMVGAMVVDFLRERFSIMRISDFSNAHCSTLLSAVPNVERSDDVYCLL